MLKLTLIFGTLLLVGCQDTLRNRMPLEQAPQALKTEESEIYSAGQVTKIEITESELTLLEDVYDKVNNCGIDYKANTSFEYAIKKDRLTLDGGVELKRTTKKLKGEHPLLGTWSASIQNDKGRSVLTLIFSDPDSLTQRPYLLTLEETCYKK